MNALAHRYYSCPSLLLALAAAVAMPAAALAETKVWLRLEFASKDEATLAKTELRQFELETLTSHPPAFRFQNDNRVQVEQTGRRIDASLTIDSNPDPNQLKIRINDNAEYLITPSKPVSQASDKSLIAEFTVRRLVRVRFSPLPFEKFTDVVIRESSGPGTGPPPEKAPLIGPDHYRSNPIVRAADGYIYFNVLSDDQPWHFRLSVPLAKIPPETDRPFTPAELADALDLTSGRDNQVVANARNALVKKFTREFDEAMLRASIRVEDP